MRASRQVYEIKFSQSASVTFIHREAAHLNYYTRRRLLTSDSDLPQANRHAGDPNYITAN